MAIGERTVHKLTDPYMRSPTDPARDRCRELYLNLLEQTLTGAILEDIGFIPAPDARDPALASRYDKSARTRGVDWPSHAQTMIGLARLRNLRHLVTQVLDEDIPGDLIETGVWRGGACIYMRALMAAYDINDRRVWVADSRACLRPIHAHFPPTPILGCTRLACWRFRWNRSKRIFPNTACSTTGSCF
jgi:hypothetical protein